VSAEKKLVAMATAYLSMADHCKQRQIKQRQAQAGITSLSLQLHAGTFTSQPVRLTN
jgi:hypothetical protein